ncbi:BICD family-like cargo adapter 1 [Corythoichthys intestinalis]|uniref:BICD family-like cargo adapter 1 n=1 Tax=Corythoichthys intestinalis TaxID=161448 RepID=UPI0025A5EF0D|nr:BICD family-like cargo adapter 1 [Corythoichthys intestinalis]XP_061796963.1 BICD family-like cargo adapter 1 [Nerophis lumbriciformis]
MNRPYEWGFSAKQMGQYKDLFIDYGEEEIVDYQDPGQLVAALKQKEEEVILAAQLGNALLLENRQLKEQSDKIHEKYAHKIEELEQSNHKLRLKLENCQSQWESQVGYLERDARELSAQVQQLTQALCLAERDKTQAQMDYSENTQQLKEKLNTAKEVERVMSCELQTLKQDVKKNSILTRAQDEEMISSMREQVLRLTQREQALEERLESVCQENAELRANLASLNARLALHDQLQQQHSQQLTEALQELEVARCRSQQLQAQVEELEEQVSLQEYKNVGDVSLLSELDMADLGVSKEELTEEMGVILQLLQPLAEKTSTHCEDKDQENLKDILHQLKTVAQTLTQTSGTQKLQLQQENAAMRQKLQRVKEQAEVAQQAIRDRDEAIAKKNLMEAELVRSKNEMMSLNNQLLDAIQRKLELSQELEAWQDDIQIVINQQLKSQQQSEQPQKKITSQGMSFFRKSNRATFPWNVDNNQDKAQSPWREWLRRGKGASCNK